MSRSSDDFIATVLALSFWGFVLWVARVVASKMTSIKKPPEKEKIESPLVAQLNSHPEQIPADRVSSDAITALPNPGPGLKSAEQTENGQATRTTEELKGVGGWLMYMCVGLVFLGPAAILFQIFATLQTLDLIATEWPGFRPVFAMISLLSVGIALFGIYVGVRLWGAHQDAVKKAVFYFYAQAGIPVLELFMVLNSAIPSDLQSDVVSGQIRHIFMAMVWAGIWVSYLKKSRRVKTTFGLNAT